MTDQALTVAQINRDERDRARKEAISRYGLLLDAHEHLNLAAGALHSMPKALAAARTAASIVARQLGHARAKVLAFDAEEALPNDATLGPARRPDHEADSGNATRTRPHP
jgi:hypothetical protein